MPTKPWLLKDFEPATLAFVGDGDCPPIEGYGRAWISMSEDKPERIEVTFRCDEQALELFEKHGLGRWRFSGMGAQRSADKAGLCRVTLDVCAEEISLAQARATVYMNWTGGSCDINPGGKA